MRCSLIPVQAWPGRAAASAPSLAPRAALGVAAIVLLVACGTAAGWTNPVGSRRRGFPLANAEQAFGDEIRLRLRTDALTTSSAQSNYAGALEAEARAQDAAADTR